MVDAGLAGRLGSLGDRQVEAEAKRIAYELDPEGFVNRSRAAERDRRVTLRPAPDTMARLTALLPVAQGVAAYAALIKAADTARATGDPRGRGQVMADTLVATGHRASQPCRGPGRDPPGDDRPHPLPHRSPPRRGGAPDRVRADPRRAGPRPRPRHRRRQGVGPAALHPPEHWAAGRDGQQATAVQGQAPASDHHSGPVLPHPVVRRTDPTRRPRPIGRRRRRNELQQRTRFVRGLQLRQTSPRLDHRTRTRRHQRIRDHHHPDRTHLHQPTTRPPRHAAATRRPGQRAGPGPPPPRPATPREVEALLSWRRVRTTSWCALAG